MTKKGRIMTEEQRKFMSDEEHERRLKFEAELLNNQGVFGSYARAFMLDRGIVESFLDWCWSRKEGV
jgi:hypothetical protein